MENVVKSANADNSMTSEEIVFCAKSFLQLAVLQKDIMLSEKLSRILAHFLYSESPIGDAKTSNFLYMLQ